MRGKAAQVGAGWGRGSPLWRLVARARILLEGLDRKALQLLSEHRLDHLVVRNEIDVLVVGDGRAFACPA